jgi:hypothetical protein
MFESDGTHKALGNVASSEAIQCIARGVIPQAPRLVFKVVPRLTQHSIAKLAMVLAATL